MSKHFPAGVVALTLLAIMISAITLYAGDARVQPKANSEICDLADGVCVPFDNTSGTSTVVRSSSSPAFLSLSEAKAQLTSAGCDLSQCEPMTPEQCAAAGYDSGDCIRLTPEQCAAMGITGTLAKSDQGNTAAGIINASAKAHPTSAGCDPARCESMTPEQCAAAGYDSGDCIRLTPEQCAAMDLAGTTGTSGQGNSAAVKVSDAETGTSVSGI